MECLVTGLTTPNKWKNRPIHPLVLRKAKDLKSGTGHSMIDILKRLSRDFSKVCNKKYKPGDKVDPEDYTNTIMDFFKVEDLDG